MNSKNTKKALQYALSVVKPGGKVFTGGILATLRPEWIAKEFPTVINNTGLLRIIPNKLNDIPVDICSFRTYLIIQVRTIK